MSEYPTPTTHSGASGAAAPGFAPLRPDDPETVGGFRIVGRVGTGGMGTVYAGLPGKGSGRVFSRSAYTAVKVIREDLTEDPDFHRRFTREIRLLRRVRSRTIPEFLGSGRGPDGPWLATEFVPGLSLSTHVRRHGPLPPNLLLGLATGVAEALCVVHSAGIVHRDLKPGNVVLGVDGPKVLDFGIARAVDETALTRTGGLVGTPGWTAPEVLRGTPATPAADLFAWGGLVVFAATGRGPFGSDSTDSLIHRVLHQPPDLTGVPESLLPLVTAALDRDPGQRPTASRLVAALTGHTGAEGLAGAAGVLLDREWHGVEAVAPTPPPRRTHEVLVAVGCAVFLLGAVGGGMVATGVLSSGGQEVDKDDEAVTEQVTEAPGPEETEEEWAPPEPTPFDTNAEWLAEVITSSNGLPTFQATPDSYNTLFHLSVTDVEEVPEGVRLHLVVGNLIEGHHIQELFTITTVEGPIRPVENPGTVTVEDELTLTFPDAPENGLVTFGDPDHVPGVSGFPPISQCYDADAGTVSVEYEECT